jgi:type II secretory pathway pseudopilin PulG
MSSGKKQQGFTYLAALFLVGLVGLGLAATAEIWSHTRQREKEAELIWIGNQFKQAIGLYYQRSPGAVKRFPEKLEDLLEDRRYLSMQRYLRKIYADPVVGKPDWGLVSAPSGGIMGVYSTAAAKPIRTVPLSIDQKTSASVASYRDWRFVYEPPDQGPAPSAKPVPAPR